MDGLTNHYEKLESLSRRDNLIFYGVPQTDQFERPDACASLITNALTDPMSPKKWSTDDIARAHRIGESRNGQPKPMLVQFTRWKDKMAVLTNREYRARLEHKDIRVANDLTRKQAGIAAEARKEGKIAIFKKGKLTVVPRPESRSYADVTAAAAPAPAVEASTSRAPARVRIPDQQGGRSLHSRDDEDTTRTTATGTRDRTGNDESSSSGPSRGHRVGDAAGQRRGSPSDQRLSGGGRNGMSPRCEVSGSKYRGSVGNRQGVCGSDKARNETNSGRAQGSLQGSLQTFLRTCRNDSDSTSRSSQRNLRSNHNMK